MNRLLRKCPACQIYTLDKKCSKCNTDTISPHPMHFSPDDKYAIYRVDLAHKDD